MRFQKQLFNVLIKYNFNFKINENHIPQSLSGGTHLQQKKRKKNLLTRITEYIHRYITVLSQELLL